MTTDWVALKLEYVHGTETLRDIADRHGIKSAGVMRRAANEGWDAARKQESAKVSKMASISIGEDRAARLVKFNEQDAKIAEELKSKAAKLLGGVDVNSAELNSLARVFDTAQKMGLLALGAATANTEVTTRTLEPLPDSAWL